MRIAVGQLCQESNTFNPLPTLRQNFDQFGKAFGCHKGQPMMPDDPCVVW